MWKSNVPALALFATVLLSGCATLTIDSASFARPKTVMIQDFPDLHPAATIEILVTNWPELYFSERMDRFYAVDSLSPAQRPVDGNIEAGVVSGMITGAQLARNNNGNALRGAVAGGLVAGVVGGIIEAGAEATQKKAAAFPGIFKQAMPGVDMRADLLKALKAALEAKGMQVTIASQTRNSVPRLHWPAKRTRGEDLVTGTLDAHPAVDVDVLVQLSPIAIYAAPGPLNNYNSAVGIGLAMYHGRTREFIGWQAFPSYENKLWYARYDSLVDDIARAAPAQHSALMSLVPQVARVISGEPK